MFEFGEIGGREVRDNDEGHKALFLHCEITPYDIRLIEQISQVGEDVNPGAGATVLLIGMFEKLGFYSGDSAGDSADLAGLGVGLGRQFAIATDDNIEPEAQPGEKLFYSISGGSKSARLDLKTDGSLEINGNADHAVSLNGLRIGFGNFADVLNQEFKNIKEGLDAAAASQVPPQTHSYAPAEINIDLTDSETSTVKISGVPTWIYNQRRENGTPQATGVLTDPTGVEYVSGATTYRIYSGIDAGLNDPDMQGEVDVGPIPRGYWLMSRVVPKPNLAAPVIELKWLGGPEPFSPLRDKNTFLIHGEGTGTPWTSSNGCIIAPSMQVRQVIANDYIGSVLKVVR